MTLIDERTTTDRVTRQELALARAVLDGLPLDDPLLRVEPLLPRQRRTGTTRAADPVGDVTVGLLDELASGRDRLARLASLLDAAAVQEAVLR